MEISASALNFLRNRIKLRHLRLMLVLEEERSVSRAAERLHISQAAVSKTRAEIEAEIGAPVFERINNRLEPTAFGKLLLHSAKRILSELESLSEEVAQIRGGMHGTLTIGIRSISAQPFIARAVSAFKHTHPRLTIRMIDTDLPSLLDRLAKGDISLLVGRLDAGHAREGLENRAILADPNVVIASPGHPMAKKRTVEWSELIRQRWCLTPEGFAGRLSRDYLLAHLTSLNLPFPSDLVETNSFLMILTMMQAEEYVTMVPLTVGRQVVEQGTAELVRIKAVGPTDPVCLMWRNDLALPPAARQFRDFVLAMIDADARQPPKAREREQQRALDPGARRFGVMERAKGGRLDAPRRQGRRPAPTVRA